MRQHLPAITLGKNKPSSAVGQGHRVWELHAAGRSISLSTQSPQRLVDDQQGDPNSGSMACAVMDACPPGTPAPALSVGVGPMVLVFCNAGPCGCYSSAGHSSRKKDYNMLH